LRIDVYRPVHRILLCPTIQSRSKQRSFKEPASL
jgi:hypothetical protein